MSEPLTPEQRAEDAFRTIKAWGAAESPVAIIAASIRAAEQSAREERWQPIESAPKDGTKVLLCIGKHIQIGYYGESFSSKGARYDGSGEWRRGPSLFDAFYVPPTHWMPLPPTPVAAAIRSQEPTR